MQTCVVTLNDRVQRSQGERCLIEHDMGQYPDEFVVTHDSARRRHQGTGRESVNFKGVAEAIENLTTQFALRSEVTVNLCVVDPGSCGDASARERRGRLRRE